MWPLACLSATGNRLGGFSKRAVAALSVPSRSALALLAGTLPLRYCAARFASKVSTWRLPVFRHAAGLVIADESVSDVVEVEAGGEEVSWSGPGRKRIRPNRNPPCTPRGYFGSSLSATCVEEAASRESFCGSSRRRQEEPH